jgi:hypothetical protein
MSATANETMGLLQEIRAKAGERCTMGLTERRSRASSLRTRR